MKIYDFLVYRERKEALKKEEAASFDVSNAIICIQEPGAVNNLKQKVNIWYNLHQEVQKLVNE